MKLSSRIGNTEMLGFLVRFGARNFRGWVFHYAENYSGKVPGK